MKPNGSRKLGDAAGGGRRRIALDVQWKVLTGPPDPSSWLAHEVYTVSTALHRWVPAVRRSRQYRSIGRVVHTDTRVSR